MTNTEKGRQPEAQDEGCYLIAISCNSTGIR
jgi:hypothetical protein